MSLESAIRTLPAVVFGFVGLTAAAGAQSLALVPQAAPAEVVVTAGKLLDVRTGRLIDEPSVLERGGRIVQVASGGNAVAAGSGATGGVFSRNTEPGQQQMSEADMRAIAEEAHMWGLKVAAHAHGSAGIKAAIRAGVDTIEHASLIDDEGIALAKQNGAWLSMDIYNTDYTQAEGKKNGVLEDNLRKDREIGDLQRENFRRAHAAGAKMVYGTDAGIYPHGQNAKQFAVMVRYGMTPMQAIQSATRNAADALGSKDVGVIEAGRWADMVAVAGDPTQDVSLLENIPVVIKGGALVKDAR